MKAPVFSHEGKHVSDVELPEALFAQSWNADLIHEVVVAMQGNARAGSAHTKDRSEVRGGGKKPWKQKGTGRARHGSRRSPIWTGGGVAHGPRNTKDYTRKLNKKVRAKALAVAFSKKHADGEVIFLESLVFAAPKTRDAKKLLVAVAKGSKHEDLATKRKNAAVVVLTGRDVAVEKSFQNMSNMEIVQAKDVNPVDLLTYKYVLLAGSDAAVAALSARVGA